MELLQRVPTTLVFLAALTLIAECALVGGVFDALSHVMARLGAGRVWATWLVFCLSCALVTTFLSLDTTAVLMTTIGVRLTRWLTVHPLVFALPALWLANITSLWLPASNLTNLMARSARAGLPTAQFVALMWPVALVATVIPVAAGFAIFRQHLLRGTAVLESHPRRGLDRFGFLMAALLALTCAGIVLIEPWVAASAGAAMMVALVWWRRPHLRREVSFPWRGLALTSTLFAAVAAVQATGALDPMTTALSQASPGTLLVGAGLAANGVNNLPAYLALEPAATSPDRLAALLVGVNVLSGLTWWGSVATLLWRERLRRFGVQVSLSGHLKTTGIVTLISAVAAWVTLWLAT